MEGEKESNNDIDTSYGEDLIEKSKAVEIKAEIEALKIPFQREMRIRQKLRKHFFVSKGYPSTIQHYATAIEYNPTDASYLSNRSLCYLNMNDYLSANIYTMQ